MNPTPEPAAPVATSGSRTDGMYRVMKRVLWVLVCAWALLVLGWGSLHVFIVPRIDDYRPLLQRQASQTLGLRVEIANVSVLGGWWAPQLRRPPSTQNTDIGNLYAQAKRLRGLPL